MISEEKITGNKMCVLILSTTFVGHAVGGAAG
jgi:hypothetical protein